MDRFSYHKKYHYLLKYFIMALPLIIFLFSFFIKTASIENIFQNDYYLEFVDVFTSSSFNNWYFQLLEIIGFRVYEYASLLPNLLMVYPLYILWVYIMDLILDIFALVPKLAHKLLYKLGGGIND